MKAQPRSKPSMLHCSQCGVTQEAACDCGVGYLPAVQYAARAVAENPGKSDRAIAAEIGVSHQTVARARKSTGPSGPVGGRSTVNKFTVDAPRTGTDGRTRKMPKKKPKLHIVKEEEMPTEEEAEESWQADILEQTCFLLDKQMTDVTRRKFFTYIKKEYRDEFKN